MSEMLKKLNWHGTEKHLLLTRRNRNQIYLLRAYFVTPEGSSPLGNDDESCRSEHQGLHFKRRYWIPSTPSRKIMIQEIQERFSPHNRALKTLHFQHKTGYGFSKEIKVWKLWHRYHSLALLLCTPPPTTEIRKLLYFLEGWVNWSAEKRSHISI